MLKSHISNTVMCFLPSKAFCSSVLAMPHPSKYLKISHWLYFNLNSSEFEGQLKEAEMFRFAIPHTYFILISQALLQATKLSATILHVTLLNYNEWQYTIRFVADFILQHALQLHSQNKHGNN